MFWDANNLYGWTMSQKLPVGSFKRKKNTSKFDESFIKNYNENSGEGYIFEVVIEYSKNLHDLHNELPFLPERMKDKKCKTFYEILITRSSRTTSVCFLCIKR